MQPTSPITVPSTAAATNAGMPPGLLMAALPPTAVALVPTAAVSPPPPSSVSLQRPPLALPVCDAVAAGNTAGLLPPFPPSPPSAAPSGVSRPSWGRGHRPIAYRGSATPSDTATADSEAASPTTTASTAAAATATATATATAAEFDTVTAPVPRPVMADASGYGYGMDADTLQRRERLLAMRAQLAAQLQRTKTQLSLSIGAERRRVTRQASRQDLMAVTAPSASPTDVAVLRHAAATTPPSPPRLPRRRMPLGPLRSGGGRYSPGGERLRGGSAPEVDSDDDGSVASLRRPDLSPIAPSRSSVLVSPISSDSTSPPQHMS